MYDNGQVVLQCQLDLRMQRLGLLRKIGVAPIEIEPRFAYAVETLDGRLAQQALDGVQLVAPAGVVGCSPAIGRQRDG